MKRNLFFALILTALMLASCTAEADMETAPPETETEAAPTESVPAEPAETDEPADTSAETAGLIRITEGGEHRLTGTYDGMVVVDAGKEDVTLVLAGAEITSDGQAAVYVRNAGHVTVTLEDGSGNTLTGKKGILSEADLLLNGTGALTVSAKEGHGIVSKKSLTVADGSYNITSAKDGIHAENADDPALGSILITDGTINVVSSGDGISATGTLQIDNVNAVIQSGGGAENAAAHEDEWMMGWGGGRGFFGWDADSSGTDAGGTDDETAVTSFKALKSDGDMLLNGGVFSLDSAEDTIHTNANLTLNSGVYTLAAGDDGLHADLALVINGGELTVTESYEGVEAKTIDVMDGILTIKASDDGFNASGGTSTGWNMMAAEEGVYFKVSGGTIYLDADGDGLDSNGDFIMAGGEVYVSGPTNSGNGALDYGGEAIAQGGTVIAAGAAGMAESFGTGSTQGAIMVNTGAQKAGTTVTLTDASGTVLAEYTFGKTFSNVVVTCPEIVDGGTYTLTAGTFSETVTMDGLLYGSGSGFGNMFGGGGGRGGMGTGGGKQNRTEREPEEVPETSAEETTETAEEVPQAPDVPEGEAPQMPEGAMPELPEGFDPGAMGGGFPELPEGEAPAMSGLPQGGFGGGRPGGMGEGGEPPQMP